MSNAASTKRGPYAGTKMRRERIAAAVLGLVDDGGYESVTTARVAEAADVAEATVLYHFPTKDHLLVAALERADRLSAEEWRIDEEGAPLGIDILVRAGSDVRQNEPRLRLYYLIKGLAMTPDHPATAYLRARDADAVAAFTRLVRYRQEQGLAHPAIDATTAAIQIFSLFDGLTAMWLSDPVFDLGEVLVSAIRRITGENWMEARAHLDDLSAGL